MNGFSARNSPSNARVFLFVFFSFFLSLFLLLLLLLLLLFFLSLFLFFFVAQNESDYVDAKLESPSSGMCRIR